MSSEFEVLWLTHEQEEARKHRRFTILGVVAALVLIGVTGLVLGGLVAGVGL